MVGETLSEYWDDDAPQLAASLAFYTIFSLAPVLIIAVAIVSLLFGGEAAREQVTSQVWAYAGPLAAGVVESVLEQARRRSPMATVVGLITVMVGATAAFVSLQDSLNRLWGITAKPGKAIEIFIKRRLLSFLMVLAMGLLLLGILALSTAMLAATRRIEEYLHIAPAVIQTLNLVVSFIVITTVFAVIYKVLPDAEIAWRDVWIGAAATSLLFTLGKHAIGLYLTRAAIGSAYGAAGSYVLFLVWVYYSAQVFLLGAEFTQVYVRARGAQITPTKHAVRVKKILEGMPAQ
ncbi:MAG: YihY/virulence factor BrkB family protein [Bryobacteraceae bacterium]|nr:YihY/virulence factor BrkB family protein [Bryobacteraceae bacterium]